MFGPQMTLPELAAAEGWPKRKRRQAVRPLLRAGAVVRRKVPVSPVSTQTRVVYQRVLLRPGGYLL